ncbi:MAG: hypothetical protein HC876_13175 [Chloroflexaceae bacterium]|nr:hypothetical protein [Chloroflexaceae bacterium]NJO06392.1 hypothetical protein [Chloroflexaceae bacterium]
MSMPKEAEPEMTTQDLLTILEEGLDNGRIAPHLVAYIAAELLGIDARETGYDDRVRLDETDDTNN